MEVDQGKGLQLFKGIIEICCWDYVLGGTLIGRWNRLVQYISYNFSKLDLKKIYLCGLKTLLMEAT